ncbi:MAG: flagellin [Thermoguttaceae bacterium]
MTRIYSNIPAMTARFNLSQNMSNLETSLKRLSTGFKINSGKDDPAGLIASETLRSEMTGIRTAMKNTERANMMIATADSALNEVTNLLNDIRGLVTEGANTGAMSAEMIAANQLQIDASLDAIDRIASQTTFMGKKLLDGSLDFDFTGLDRNNIQGLAVHQVTFGADKAPINVEVQVRQSAEKAALYYNNPALADSIMLQWGGNLGYLTQPFAKGTTVDRIAQAINAASNTTGVYAELGSDAIKGSLYTSSLGIDNDIIISAGTAGKQGGNVEIKYLPGTSEGIKVEYQESLGAGSPATLLVYLQTEMYQAAVAEVVDNTPGVNDNNALKFTANIPGAQYNNSSIQYVDGKATQVNWENNNPTGNADQMFAYYNDVATTSKALFGNINGLSPAASAAATLFGNLGANEYFSIESKAGGTKFNNVDISFLQDTATPPEIPAGNGAFARFDQATNSLRIYYKADGSTTFDDVSRALGQQGDFALNMQGFGFGTQTLVAAAAVTNNTQNSGGDAGTLFVVLDPGRDVVGQDANAIVDLFDLNNAASKGSERAANLFNVERTADNSGNGFINLYPAAVPGAVAPKTAFAGALQKGVTGGNVISTAADVVTALNNSAYWGITMNTNILGQLAAENAQGKYYDAFATPPVTAALAPNNRGTGVVSTFQEVAYYGNPNDGTGLQFLGPLDSPNIRFVAIKGTTELSVDYTTVPDVTGFAQAVVTGTNPNGSMIITANQKGGQFDDVEFIFKHAPPNAIDGWVEYDPGVSQAEAFVQFKDTNGVPIPNTGFTVKADERGDMFNNVSVGMVTDNLQTERVKVTFDEKTNQMRISLNTGLVNPVPPATAIDTNEVIAAINNAGIGFTANLSFAQDSLNSGAGTFATAGLKSNIVTVGGNTGTSGGHTGGTVTVWMTDQPNGAGTRPPNVNDAVALINSDQVVGKMFTSRSYTSGPNAGEGDFDFVKNESTITSGGIVEKGTITVHLVTDEKGIIKTTAKDLVTWWDKQAPETVSGISVGLVRPAGAKWDDCNDPYGTGILSPTTSIGECDELIANDIKFVGWNEQIATEEYVAKRSFGTMTSDNGINSSYELWAKRVGPEYDGYKIIYINDPTVTGSYADNIVSGSNIDWYNTPDALLPRDDCGNLITPQSTSEKGMFLEKDDKTKTISVHIREGVTTARDIELMIEGDPFTRNLFEVTQLGNGTGLVALQDDTILTKGGSLPPGNLNGAKLLFGSDATDYYLIFKSMEYGSNEFVDVQATGQDGKKTTFTTQTADGKNAEKTHGKDVDALINGVAAVGDGLNVSMSISTMSMDFTLSETAGTTPGYVTDFTITGGGATFQIGPDVVSNQQLTVGIQSVNTVKLGGASGKLYQLRKGNNADLKTDTNKAFSIIQEAIVAVTSIRGRLGTMQKATFDTNITVLGDTLESITAAESQIRDTDFAEETSNLTRAQILVQSNISTLGIANQIPNYMLGLIGR